MKVKTRYAKVNYHHFVEHEDGTITKESGHFAVYGNRLTEAGCKNKTPEGYFFDGMEIVTEVYEVDESVIRQFGTLIAEDDK